VLRAVFAVAGLFLALEARAQDANHCDVQGEHPDLITGDISNPQRWGSSSGIQAYSVRTDACNIGTCEANWIEVGVDHPVIAQNVYRLENGRFEQLGQSWLKHGYATIQRTVCSLDCLPSTDDFHLGVDCSDAYSSSLNGNQVRMGPKSEVNPVTGEFPWEPTDFDTTGNSIYKRLQVAGTDVDPALHPNAQYFVEVHYVAKDDANGGPEKRNNNASYRRAEFTVRDTGGFNLGLLDATVREQPAVAAWAVADPTVRLTPVDADGRFWVGARASDIGGGRWRYEYAIHNFNSHDSARSFTVPLRGAAIVSNIGFHDVAYHSGEPISGTDWPGVYSTTSNTVSWSTSTFAQNANANALRWGTLYNFRFDANFPPVITNVTLGLFRSGGSIQFATLAPYACVPSSATELSCANGVDEDCNQQIDCADLECCTVAACADGIDADGDDVAECDCDDGNPDVWSTPGEAEELHATRQTPGGPALLSWMPPLDPGSGSIEYDALRSNQPGFGPGATCLTLADPSQPAVTDAVDPSPDGVFFYLVRAVNGCPGAYGVGSLGFGSAGGELTGPACP
jgi:hypothetical protein